MRLRFLLIFILVGFFHMANCQNGEAWTMQVSVTHNNNTSCNTGYSYGGTNISVTFLGATQSNSDGGPVFSAFFADADGTMSGTVSISSSAKCKCTNTNFCSSDYFNTVGGSIPVSHTPANGNCRTISQTFPSGSYSATVVIKFIKTMNQPTIDSPLGVCGNSSVTLSTLSEASASGYKWSVAEATGSTYYEITGKTTQTIAVNASDLDKPGFTLGSLRKITVEDAGCGGRSASSNSFSIFLPAPTAASLEWTDPQCFGDDNGAVKINTVTGSVSNYSFTLQYDDGTGYGTAYQQSFATSSFPVTIDNAKIVSQGKVPYGMKAGKWRLKIANDVSPTTLGSCFTMINKTLIEPTKLTATATTSDYHGKGVKCFGDSNGSISVTASGGNSGGYTYLWSNNTTGTSISNLGAGDYWVTVTDSKGCTDTKSPKIIEPELLAVSIAKTKAASCSDSSDGKLTATPAGGTSPFTYVWSNGQTIEVASNLAKGNYNVTVTDVNGCTATDTEDPGAPAAIIVTLDGTPPTCADGNNGRVWVTQVDNAPGAIRYLWDNGDDTYETLNLNEDTYTVTVSSDNAGVTCTGKASKQIIDPAAWTATLSPALAYNGAAIKCNGYADGRLDVTLKNDLNQTVNGEFYTWSNGVAGASVKYIDQLAEGTYSVTVRYKGICNATASLAISDPEPVTANVSVSSNHHGFNITCPGAADGSLHAVGAGGTGSSFSFLWNTGTSGADLTGKSSGSYTVVATDVNGCTGPGSGSLNDPPPIVPDIKINSNYSGQAISCRDKLDAKLEGSATGGAGGYTYSWNTGVSGAFLNGIGAGTYTVTVTDANSCSRTKSQTLINPTEVIGSIAVKSDFQGQAIRCYNESNGKLEASGAGGAGGYSYVWNTGFNGAILQNIGAGTYNVTVKDANGCAAQIVSKALINPDPITTSISITSDYNGVAISCDGATDGALLASASGGTGIFTYSWNTGASGATLNGLSKGTYTVMASDQNGCSGQFSKLIDDPDPVVATIVNISDYNGFGIKCAGDQNGFMEASAAGGTGAYSFVWENTTETTYRISDIGAGTYKVIVTDVNGCDDDQSADIIAPASLSLTAIQKIDPKCFGGDDGSIRLQATGGAGNYEYDRDLQGWQTSNDFIGLSATAFTFNARDINQCETNIAESLGEPTEIKITFTDIEPAFCADPRGKATAVATGGTGVNYTYEWKDASNAIIDTDATIENRAAGAYYITVHDENNCPSLSSIGIVSTDGPVAEVDELIPTKCWYTTDGIATLKVTTGNGPYTFLWPDGQTTIQGKNLPKGSHIVTITDTYGCNSVIEVVMTTPEKLSVNLIETIMPSCTGYTDGKLIAEASGGTPGYVYSWNGVSGAEASSLGRGIYAVQVKDANGCQIEKSFALNEPTLLEVNLVERQLPTCFGFCDGSIEVVAKGSNGVYQYAWMNQTGAKALNICAGDHTVTVTDNKGCVLEKTYNLGQPEILQSKLVTVTRPSCYQGCDGNLEITAFGGNGNYKYAWTEGSQSSLIENICAGDHLVTITDAKGCEIKNKTFTLDQPEPVQARIVKEQMPFCNGDCSGSLQIEGYGGSGGYKYVWSTGITTATISNLCAGDHTLTVTDQKNCVLNNKTFTLSQPDVLKLNLVQMTPPTCYDGCDGALRVEALGGNGNYKYTWSTGTTDALAQGLCVQEYSVVVSDAQACISTANYSVENAPQLIVDLGVPLTICVGQKHQLDAGSQWVTYKWTSNTGFTGNTQKVTIDQAGLYEVEVINAVGCTAKDDFILQTSTDLLNAEFFLATTAVVGDTVVMVDVSWPLPESIQWEYPTSMKKILDLGDMIYGKFSEPGLYQIKLHASLGECKDEMSKTISILKEEQDSEGGRLGYEKFVKNFELYPNPNDGSFEVSIELAEESAIVLSVWNTITSLNIGIWRDNDKSYYLKQVDLRPLGSGTYVLRLDHAKGSETIRFVVH